MFQDVERFIREWYTSDYTIILEVSKDGYTGELLLESMAYYFNGKRYREDYRSVDFEGDDELFWMIDDNYEIFNYVYKVDDLIDELSKLVDDGFTLKVEDMEP